MLSKEDQDKRKHNHLCRDCGAVLHASNVHGAYCEETQDHRISGRCDDCWNKIGELWALEWATSYGISICRATHNSPRLDDFAVWYRPYAIFNIGEGKTPLPHMSCHELPERKADGSFPGCDNHAWILTDEEVNHYKALNQHRADIEMDKKEAKMLLQDAEETLKQARKLDFEKRMEHSFTIKEIEDEGGKTKSVHERPKKQEGLKMEIKIDAKRLAELIIENANRTGATDWKIYADQDGRLDVRHNTYELAEWYEIYDFYSGYEVDAVDVDELAEWLKSDGLSLADIEGKNNDQVFEDAEKISLSWV